MVNVSVQTEFTYRATHWSSVFGLFLKMFVVYYFWTAVFTNMEYIGDFQEYQMIFYVILAMILNQLNAFGVGRTLSLMIARGEIAVELVKPYFIIGKLMSYNIGQKIVEVAKDALVLLVVLVILVRVTIPLTPIKLLFFCISSLVGMLLMQLIDIFFSIIAFWTTNTWGIWILRNSIVAVFSGALLPISIYPSWFRVLCRFLPFKTIIYDPISVLLGAEFIGYVLPIQLIWLIVVVTGLFFCWRRALRRVVVYGG